MASAFASSAAAGLEDMTEAIRSELFADTCRYYEKELPDSEELVMVHVRRIAEMGAYVELLEYENREGMVLLSELSRRRIRSIHRLIKPGENAVVMVIRVDKEQGARRTKPDAAPARAPAGDPRAPDGPTRANEQPMICRAGPGRGGSHPRGRRGTRPRRSSVRSRAVRTLSRPSPHKPAPSDAPRPAMRRAQATLTFRSAA